MRTCRSGIYAIENVANGNRYVGGAVNLSKRRSDHVRALRKGTHHSRYLQNAYNKYGEFAFVFRVIMYCNKESLVALEQAVMDIKSEYNICKTARSHLGMKRSPETLVKMREATLGRRLTPLTKLKLSIAAMGHTRNRKLTTPQVHDIRHLLALGDMTQTEIAERFPVSAAAICRIKLGYTYKEA